MSGVNVIWTLLTTNSALTAVVPVAQIKSGILPENISIPAIAISKISGTDMNMPHPGSTVLVTERVQVSVLAANYNQQAQVIKLVRAACRDQHGTIATFSSVAVLTDVQGADAVFGELTGIYMQTQDFKVTYAETP